MPRPFQPGGGWPIMPLVALGLMGGRRRRRMRLTMQLRMASSKSPPMPQLRPITSGLLESIQLLISPPRLSPWHAPWGC
jgi:hypothetical protein